MFGMTDLIVSFWFIPVTVFIIIPLLVLCGYAVLKLLRQLKLIPEFPRQKAKSDRVLKRGVRDRYGLPDNSKN